MNKAHQYQLENKQRYLDELFEILRIPSISADSSYSKEIINCAQTISKNLRESGLDHVEICQTKGNPVVYADKIINSELPT